MWASLRSRIEGFRGNAPTFMLGCALVFCAIYCVAYLFLPFFWDHGILASAGEPYARGGMPFRDSWDVKGPLAFVPFAIAQVVFGYNQWGIRVVDLIIQAPALFVLYRLVAERTTPVLGAWTAIGLFLWIGSAGWQFTAQPEVWVMALQILAIAPFLRKDPTPTFFNLALAGVAIGALGLVKPFFLAVGLAPLLAILLAPNMTWTRRAVLALVLGVSALAPIVIVCAYFAARGAFDQMFEAYILYNLTSYSGTEAGLKNMINKVAIFCSLAPHAVMAPFVIIGAWVKRHDYRFIVPLLAWFAMALLGIFLQSKFYVYHWFPIYPPLIILAAFGVHDLAKTSGDHRSAARIAAFGAALVFIVQTAAQPVKDTAKAAYFFAIKHDPDGYYRTYEFFKYNAADEVLAAEYLKAHSTPTDRVFVWSVDQAVRLLAERPAATRFSVDLPLSMPSGYRDQYRQEVITDLRRDPPKFFVLGFPYGHRKEDAIESWPEMGILMMELYARERSFGFVDIYRLKNSPTP